MLIVIAVFSMWGWNAERPGRRYHAERGNHQGEADEVIALAEKSEVPLGKVIPGRRSFPRSAWECSH
jgi:hypothetical protein